ncbi:MAG: hypothetical protein C4520_08930 [Candidatus Abyssobacteria bacterium SURF_5]|uniref:FhlB domain-containing protein n=1 Tax=Abyssobacteria bacterium (strain SURF_5) TaxID=2093360 RepID=A0A3A4NY06_ABYX5|nr:MAG: hypothetical protein C4520_08930 [Candidatus Abyssubacteria bacterium SURF_5]
MTDETKKAANDRKKAVALRYDPAKEQAPRVIAAGKGHVAERIIEVARSYGVSVHEDKDLVELLSRIELYDLIPIELYQVIAEVLAFIYRMNRKTFPL